MYLKSKTLRPISSITRRHFLASSLAFGGSLLLPSTILAQTSPFNKIPPNPKNSPKIPIEGTLSYAKKILPLITAAKKYDRTHLIKKSGFVRITNMDGHYGTQTINLNDWDLEVEWNGVCTAKTKKGKVIGSSSHYGDYMTGDVKGSTDPNLRYGWQFIQIFEIPRIGFNGKGTPETLLLIANPRSASFLYSNLVTKGRGSGAASYGTKITGGFKPIIGIDVDPVADQIDVAFLHPNAKEGSIIAADYFVGMASPDAGMGKTTNPMMSDFYLLTK